MRAPNYHGICYMYCNSHLRDEDFMALNYNFKTKLIELMNKF